MENYNETFKKRTKQLALVIIRLYGQWKKTDESSMTKVLDTQGND